MQPERLSLACILVFTFSSIQATKNIYIFEQNVQIIHKMYLYN